jgi:hypothetical protein
MSQQPDAAPEPEPEQDEPIIVVQVRPDYIEKSRDVEGLETRAHPAAPESDA